MAKYNSQQFQIYLDSQQAWDIIENKSMGYDRDIDELYPPHFISENTSIQYEKKLNTILLKDEKYALLDDKCSGYAISSYGRIINCQFLKPKVIIVYFSNSSLTITVRGIKLHLVTEFTKHGWEFDIDNIRRIYNENRWSIKDKTNPTYR